MIVKNEEKYLPDCLKAVSSHVDEIIVVDTGSTDGTKKIAMQAGAKVFDFAWCENFSAARDFSLSKASGDWILVLDADEILENPQEMKVLITQASSTIGGFTVEQRTYVQESVKNAQPNTTQQYPYPYHISFFPVRLFRKGITYTYRVHEQVEVDIARKHLQVKDSALVLHHLGSIRSPPTIKAKTYAALLQKQLKEHPDARTHYLLAQFYLDEKQDSKALHYFALAATKDPTYKTPFREMGMIYAKKKEYAKAIEAFKHAVARKPEDAASWNNLAVMLMYQKDMLSAKQVLEKGLTFHPENIQLKRNLLMVRGRC